MQFSTMAGTAVGMAVAKGAEKTLADLDKAVQHTRW